MVKAATLRTLLPSETETLKKCPAFEELLANNPKPRTRGKRVYLAELSTLTQELEELEENESTGKEFELSILSRDRRAPPWVKWLKVAAYVILAIVAIGDATGG